MDIRFFFKFEWICVLSEFELEFKERGESHHASSRRFYTGCIYFALGHVQTNKLVNNSTQCYVILY
jgi:hypothetical protein